MPVSRCICHDISFAELKKLAEAGARDLEALSRQTGCGTGCGMCIPYIRVMLATGDTDQPVLPDASLRRSATMDIVWHSIQSNLSGER